eukprot:4502884-Heterocapsa_arctica.AAC.1
MFYASDVSACAAREPCDLYASLGAANAFSRVWPPARLCPPGCLPACLAACLPAFSRPIHSIVALH